MREKGTFCEVSFFFCFLRNGNFANLHTKFYEIHIDKMNTRTYNKNIKSNQ